MKKYNIGLDIGTTSVGWAVVDDENFKIIRKGNKALWGVRLFEEAKTAEERRNFRSTRRRYDRRRYRIKLLQEEFCDEINKVDKDFFQKLQESKYNEIDNQNKKIKLAKEEKELIKKYNDNYKTIYHLRDRLIKDSSKEDIRLVYLAIHHIVKYRGNFLYGNSSFNVNNLNLKEKLKEFLDSLQNNIAKLEIPEDYENLIELDNLSSLLLNPSKNDIKVGIKEAFLNITNKQFSTELGKALVGNKFSVNKLFMLEDEDAKMEINFNGTDYDDKYNELENLIGDKLESLELLKELYDTIFLKRLFKGSNNSSISELMVQRYNQHRKDLKLLKELFDNNRELYNKLFRTKKDLCLYDRYITNKITNEEFIRELKKLLEKLFDSNIEQKYKNRTDQESMMMKSQEMMMIYKKYEINPMSGCLFSFLQIPLFLAFYEALNRLPVIFEGHFLALQLGTTPMAGIRNGQYYYLIVIVLVIGASYLSMKLNSTASMRKEQAAQMKMMTNMMIVFLGIASVSLSTGTAIYWVTNSTFTILQNLWVKRRKEKNA